MKTNNATRISPSELKEVVKKIRAYFDSFKNIYVGRDRTIDLVLYAMLQKAHLLFFGVPGTAKTAIADSIFEGITGAKKFTTQFTAFMSDDAIFGPLNIKKMREEGIYEHNTMGMLPEANLASLDEILDANPAVFRSLLSVLNERRMVKGRQVLDVPLHLAYCATNVDPFLYLKRNPQAWAVFDRITFLDRIHYLDNSTDLAEMVRRFQYKVTADTNLSIDLEMVNAVCDYILLPPTLIQDQLIFRHYGNAILEYRLKRREMIKGYEKELLERQRNGDMEVISNGVIFSEISDRRVCWASHMFEVHAVLDGRIEVLPEDMYAADLVLCTSDDERAIWKEIIDRNIEEIKETKKNTLSEMQLNTLMNLQQQFTVLRNDSHEIETRVNGVATLCHQLENIHPEGKDANDLFKELHAEIEKYKEQVTAEYLKYKGLDKKGN